MCPTVYLDTVPWQEALNRLFAALPPGEQLLTTAEEVTVSDAAGRVTAEPVFARISSPHYHAAGMDGYAVRSEDTFGASETSPVRLKIGRQAVWVDTSDPLPYGFDAVIMVEDVHLVNEDTIEIITPAAPWQDVRLVGEDIVATEMLLPAGHHIRPVDVGGLLAAGVGTVKVRRKPVVAIIPTGDEIVAPGQILNPGEIPDYNSAVMAGLVREWGGEPLKWGILPDEFSVIKENTVRALEVADIVVINAGSAMGSEDYTATVIKELGQVLVHGADIKPGKPVILGAAQGKPLLGIPGYPVSAYITFNLFVKPLVFTMLGLPLPEVPRLKAVMSRRAASALGVEEFLRVKVGKVGDRFIATPIARGAAIISSLVKADGIVRVPRLAEGLAEGQEVDVELLRPLDEIKNNLLAIGSHDITLDILASELRSKFPGRSLSSANVGSLGGISATKRGECHLAGVHLLDEETGEYNVSYVKRLLPRREVVLVTLAHREQGLLVAKGNPKKIRDFTDLIRPDVVFINRQRGAGTRILLDYKLRELGLNPDDIKGYQREEYTHMAVAAAVSNGAADVGLGILAAANAMGLDFIPVTTERYDLLITREQYETELVQDLLQIVRSNQFKRQVQSLGGYDLSQTGQEIWITP